jgi:hypothetical protein
MRLGAELRVHITRAATGQTGTSRGRYISRRVGRGARRIPKPLPVTDCAAPPRPPRAPRSAACQFQRALCLLHTPYLVTSDYTSHASYHRVVNLNASHASYHRVVNLNASHASYHRVVNLNADVIKPYSGLLRRTPTPMPSHAPCCLPFCSYLPTRCATPALPLHPRRSPHHPPITHRLASMLLPS